MSLNSRIQQVLDRHDGIRLAILFGSHIGERATGYLMNLLPGDKFISLLWQDRNVSLPPLMRRGPVLVYRDFLGEARAVLSSVIERFRQVID